MTDCNLGMAQAFSNLKNGLLFVPVVTTALLSIKLEQSIFLQKHMTLIWYIYDGCISTFTGVRRWIKEKVE